MRDASGLAWGRDGDGGRWRDSRGTWDAKAIGLDRQGNKENSQEQHLSFWHNMMDGGAIS